MGPILLAIGVLVAAALVYRQTAANLAERGIATGFGFIFREASFAIGEVVPIPTVAGPGAAYLAVLATLALLSGAASLSSVSKRGPARLILRLTALVCVLGVLALLTAGMLEINALEYGPQHTFAFALVTGFANTVKVGIASIVLASLLGFVIGLGRLSTNLLVRSAATAYVETLRNVPLLIQVFFWYFGVLRALPSVRNSVDFFGLAAFNNRGVFLPKPEAAPGLAWFAASLCAAGIVLFWLKKRADVRQQRSGRRPPVALPFLSLLTGLCGLSWLFLGAPLRWSYPVRSGFNFQGGLTLTPEFAALLIAISLYTAAFIAEIVRSGVQGVSKGQWEAARALGLSDRRIMRLVVLPQAMRVIFPPLISQYLSLVKDSSLGITIAYPELVSISNTMINQTGQPIEVLTITIAVFMVMNLVISAVINWYNEARPWIVR